MTEGLQLQTVEDRTLMPYLAPKSAQVCATISVRSVTEFILKK